MKNDTKKIEQSNPLADALRAAIDHTEKKHAAIYEYDAPKAPMHAGQVRTVGRRWSEEVLRGSSYDDQSSTARAAAKGFFTTCAREVGGCGGVGYRGHGERTVCDLCNGAGRFPSEAGLEVLRFVAQALAPEPKPEARPEVIAENNARVAAAEEAREKAQAAQMERARQERAVLADTAAKLDALRGNRVDPLVEHETARQIHERGDVR